MKTMRLLLVAPFGVCLFLYSVHSAFPTEPSGFAPALADPSGRPPVVHVADEAEHNLLVNGGFEAGLAHWQIDNFGKHTRMEVDPGQRHDDHISLRIMNTVAAHTFVRQIVIGKANTHYRLSGFIMTKDVKLGPKVTESGAVLMVGRLPVHTPLLVGTQPWTPVSVEFTTNADATIRVGPSLGTDAGFATGTAWFAELKLVEAPDQGQSAPKSARLVQPRYILPPFLLASDWRGTR